MAAAKRSNGGRPKGSIGVSRDRHLAALDLRKKGASYAQIAKQLNYASTAAAYQAVHDQLRELVQLGRDSAKEVLELELERLDALLWTYVARSEKGDAKAGEMVLKIIDRRSKFLGLDPQPQGQETLTLTSANPDERRSVVEAWLHRSPPPAPASGPGSADSHEGED